MLTGNPCTVQAKKQERCAVDVSASFDDADAAAEGVRLRVEMQRAVEEERCGVSAARQQGGRLASQSPAFHERNPVEHRTPPNWQKFKDVCR